MVELKTLFLVAFCCHFLNEFLQSESNKKLSVSGYQHWVIGCDSATIRLIPPGGTNGLREEGKRTVAHARFKVKTYGEMWFPINNASGAAGEALAVDLSKSRFIKIVYRANYEVLLQLRQ